MALVGLNTHRREKFKERVKAIMAKRQQMAKAAQQAAAAAAAASKPTTASNAAGLPTMASKPSAPPFTTSAITTAMTAPATAAIQQQQPSRNVNFATTGAHKQDQHNATTQSDITTANPMSKDAPPPPSNELPSPDLSSSPSGLLGGLPSSLSVSGLPLLEDAALELGDINLSTSDLMGTADEHAAAPSEAAA